MDGYALFFMLLLGGSLIGGLFLSALTRWRIWVVAISVAACVFAVGAMFPHDWRLAIQFGFWNAVVAFVLALIGAAFGALARRERFD